MYNATYGTWESSWPKALSCQGDSSAPHFNTVVWPVVKAQGAEKQIPHVPDGAPRVRVVLPGARHPLARVLDVDLARRVVEP